MNSSDDQRSVFPGAPNGRPPRADEKRDKDRRRPAPAGRREKTEPSLLRRPKRHECLTSADYPWLPAKKRPPRRITASEGKRKNPQSGPACVRAKACRPKDVARGPRKYLRE